MTAIAGLVGVPRIDPLDRMCGGSLDALRLYGDRRSIRVCGGAAFGLLLHEMVPEDRFDQQPYDNGRFLLVADVRLDNRFEILSALGESSGGSARMADSDILFRAWCRWQERCLDLIVGDYALAVHDRESGKLVLARDPIGQRPLFYANGDGTLFLFASMPSGIIPHVGSSLDPLRLARRLAGDEDHTRESYFQGIRRVLSGEAITFSGGRASATRWNPRLDQFEGRTQSELADDLRSQLDMAVSARLRSAVEPIASHLSSGYDSSAVTATAARLYPRKSLVAFTSAPAVGSMRVPIPGRIDDESSLAGRTAKFLGVRHRVVRNGQPLLDTLRGHVRYYQEPVRNVLNMDWWAAIERQAFEHGARVLLTAEAGNMSISVGGLSTLAEWVRQQAWRRWWNEAVEASRRHDVRWRGILMSSFRLYMPERASEELRRLFLGQPRWTSACFARHDLIRQMAGDHAPPPRTPAAERLEVLRGFDAGAFRKGSLAMTGIDERDATADRRLLEFALRLPPEAMLHRGLSKPLARAALADRLPPWVLDAPFRGYQGADWFARISRNDALETLEEISANAVAKEVIDLRRLRSAIDGWPTAHSARGLALESFGRHLTNALAMGMFIIESQGPMGV